MDPVDRYDAPILTETGDEDLDADCFELMEWGFEFLTRVSYEALKEEELEPLPEEEDWD